MEYWESKRRLMKKWFQLVHSVTYSSLPMWLERKIRCFENRTKTLKTLKVNCCVQLSKSTSRQSEWGGREFYAKFQFFLIITRAAFNADFIFRNIKKMNLSFGKRDLYWVEIKCAFVTGNYRFSWGFHFTHFYLTDNPDFREFWFSFKLLTSVKARIANPCLLNLNQIQTVIQT